MSKIISVNQKIRKFKSQIIVPGDKSLSIRWVLLSSLADGVSRAKNLLLSEDVLATIKAIKKLGIKATIKNNRCRFTAKA